MNASPVFTPVHEVHEHAGPAPRLSALPPAEPPPERGVGRPSTCTKDRVYAVCTYIRLTGLSDTAAAALAGVKRSTLSRWKREDEEVEMQLTAARAEYLMPRLEKIGRTTRADGQLDWRAQAWLVKFASPETEGRPSSRRRLRDVELTEEELRAAEAKMAAASGVMEGCGDAGACPDENVAIRPEIHAAPPVEVAAAQNVAIRPEITVAPVAAGAGGAQNVAIRPEIAEPRAAGRAPQLV